MHFTRHSVYDDGRPRPGHRPRRRRLHLGRPGQALPRRPGRPVHRPGRARPHRARRGRRQAGVRARVLPALVLRPPARPSSWPSGSPTYAPGDLNRVFFTTGGGEAVETAWKLAKQYFKLTGKPHQAQGDQPRRSPTTARRRARCRSPASRTPRSTSSRWYRARIKVPNTNFYRAPRARRRPRGVRPLGRRPDRGGDRVRGSGHGRRRVPRAGAELRRLLPAAARLPRSGSARSATSTTCCSSPTRRSARSAASATMFAMTRYGVTPGHHHLRQGHDLRLLPASAR